MVETKTTKEIYDYYKKMMGFQSINHQETIANKSWFCADELRKELDDYLEVSQKNVNKLGNNLDRNNREATEHFLYWHATLKTLEFLKQNLFNPTPLTKEQYTEMDKIEKEIKKAVEKRRKKGEKI
jgi:hypothetical protein